MQTRWISGRSSSSRCARAGRRPGSTSTLTSAEYIVDFFMAPISQVLEPPTIPARFIGTNGRSLSLAAIAWVSGG
jgi:hypothetical protein